MGDFPSTMDHNAPESPESRLVGGAIQKTREIAKAASPITYVSKDDPPFLIDPPVGDLFQQVADQVEPGGALVVGLDHEPR